MVDYKIGVNWGLSRRIGEFFEYLKKERVDYFPRL